MGRQLLPQAKSQARKLAEVRPRSVLQRATMMLGAVLTVGVLVAVVAPSAGASVLGRVLTTNGDVLN